MMMSLAISQVTDTENIKNNCFTDGEVSEIYKGLKQGEWLKEKLHRTEDALDISQDFISAQMIQLEAKDEIINVQEQMYEKLNVEMQMQMKADSLKMYTMNNNIKMLEKKKKSNFWKGAKIGSVVGFLITIIIVK